MNVKNKEGESQEVLGEINVGGEHVVILGLKHARYVAGYLTRFIAVPVRNVDKEVPPNEE